MDFESELAENDLEFMAKDMRTQPTSQNSILESQNLDFGSFPKYASSIKGSNLHMIEYSF